MALTLPLNGVSYHLAFKLVVWTAVARWHRPFSEGPVQAVKAILVPAFIRLEDIAIPHAWYDLILTEAHLFLGPYTKGCVK